MRRNSLNSKTLPSVIEAVALVAGLAVSAHGQTALGTGRGLERDLRKNGTGNTPPRDFGAEVRLRNSMVTGNAAGGRSLRIAAPYSDPADFRDSLGSSDIFAFRRDTLYSGLGGRGYRGTEGLQYQFGWSTGGSSGGLTASALDAQAGREATSLTNQVSTETSPTRFATRSWDVAAPVTGSMRSTASFTSTRSLTPTAIGLRQTEEGGREIVAASTLLGLRAITLEKQETWNQPLGVVPASAQPQSPTGNVTLKPSDTPATNPLGAQPAGTRPEATGEKQPGSTTAQRTAYDDLRARLDAYASPTKKSGEDASSTDAKPATGSTPGTKPESTAKPSTPGSDAKSEKPEPSAWEQRLESLRSSLRKAESSKASDADAPPLDASTIRAIREAGQEKRTATSITEPLGRTNIFAEHVKAAEKALADERYFDAEERFARAITVRSGDANALAGRINAQLGSGLFVSAAVNLRTLAVTKPEAIGMIFEDNLLPSRARQAALITQLRGNIAPDAQVESRVPKESALLLAYLGYQRSDQVLVREGLNAFATRATAEEQVLLTFLRGVWLGEEAPK